jgi:hypothetical protein
MCVALEPDEKIADRNIEPFQSPKLFLSDVL